MGQVNLPKSPVAVLLLLALHVHSSVANRHITLLLRRHIKVMLVGFVIGILFTGCISFLLAYKMNYGAANLTNRLLYAPVIEETLKFAGLLLVYMYFQKKNRGTYGFSEFVMLGAGIGFGFGIFETYVFVANGDSLAAMAMRLFLAVPLHACTGAVTGYGVATRNYSKMIAILFCASIPIHSLSNLFAWLNRSALDVPTYVIVFALVFLILFKKSSFWKGPREQFSVTG
jgi:RsiW-degrading membrane proteinase PrsW (M82 family)